MKHKDKFLIKTTIFPFGTIGEQIDHSLVTEDSKLLEPAELKLTQDLDDVKATEVEEELKLTKDVMKLKLNGKDIPSQLRVPFSTLPKGSNHFALSSSPYFHVCQCSFYNQIFSLRKLNWIFSPVLSDHVWQQTTNQNLRKIIGFMAQFTLSLLLLLLFLGPFIAGVANVSAIFTLVNSCQETIWPGISSSPASENLSSMGFALGAGDSKSIPTPTSWNGRIWARTHCSQNSSGGFSCLTGDCGSGTVECTGGSKTPLLTHAKFNLGTVAIRTDSMDLYDVSLVDGFNLPMLLGPVGNGADCSTTGCTVDLIETYPSELKITNASETLGCEKHLLSIQHG